MAGAGVTIARRIRSMLGADAVEAADDSGTPRVAPQSEEAVALVLGTAAAEGWRVRIQGAASWMPTDAPADLALTTRRLSRITYLNAPDLVATAEAGIGWNELRQALADQGAWTPTDPPGAGRSLGSIVATGTAGPLRGGFGNIRDHLLGLTLITGEGRVVRPGGRVVKNVAGFDLTKLAAGSFGAFGAVTSVTLRLRAVPRADATLTATGPRDTLLNAALEILSMGITPAALELLSPPATRTTSWTLAVRLTGADREVEATRDAVCGAASLALAELPVPDAARFWPETLAGATSEPTTIRVGALPSSLDTALDLLEHHLPEGWLSVAIAAGAIRWTGSAPPERLRLLRHATAQQEMPLTLERAPWEIRREVGHFGAYREGVGRLVAALRRTFDPEQVLVTAVGTEG